MTKPDAFVEPTLAELIRQRNRLNTEINLRTAKTENNKLQKELAAQERTYQEWLSNNDDAAHDLLIRAAFESGFVAGAEWARAESREGGNP